MKLMEVFGRPNNDRSTQDASPPTWGRHGQDSWNVSGRDIYSHKVGAAPDREDRRSGNRQQPAPDTQRFHITIDGKVWKKQGLPVSFFNVRRAEGAAEKIRTRMAERHDHRGEVKIVPAQRQ